MPDRDYKEFADTAWSAPDIKSLKPTWDRKQCEEFLDKWEQKLRDHMVEAGWNFIRHALTEDGE